MYKLGYAEDVDLFKIATGTCVEVLEENPLRKFFFVAIGTFYYPENTVYKFGYAELVDLFKIATGTCKFVLEENP